MNNISISRCPDAGAELRASAAFLTARKCLYLQETKRRMPERLNNTFFVKELFIFSFFFYFRFL